LALAKTRLHLRDCATDLIAEGERFSMSFFSLKVFALQHSVASSAQSFARSAGVLKPGTITAAVACDAFDPALAHHGLSASSLSCPEG
jgi:hypothetical protein